MTHKKRRQSREKSEAEVPGKLFTVGNSAVHIIAVTE